VNIADHAIRAAQTPALIVADGDAISYGELYARSQRVAALLVRSGAAARRRGRAGLPNRPEFLEITWGCQLSGLYYSAVNTHFTPDEVAYVVDDSEAMAVFIDASIADLGSRILSANPGVDVHIGVGGSLPGWRPYEEALDAAGDAPQASDGSESSTRPARPVGQGCSPGPP